MSQLLRLQEILTQFASESLSAHTFDAFDKLAPGGKALEQHIATVETANALRQQLAQKNLVAFIANGAVLPRRSGVDPRPLPGAIPFKSPDSLEVTLETPDGAIAGLGIPQGVTLIVGGGIANTVLAAAGFNVGASLYEPDLVPEARKLMEMARERGGEIPIPVDVVTGKSFDAETPAELKLVADVADDDMIFDIGPQTAAAYSQIMRQAGTILWNGPVGVFEFEAFADGTREVGRAIAESNAFSIAGGGDTLAAIDRFGLAELVSYISTGGGAFLEFIEGKELPAVAMLKSRA